MIYELLAEQPWMWMGPKWYLSKAPAKEIFLWNLFARLLLNHLKLDRSNNFSGNLSVELCQPNLTDRETLQRNLTKTIANLNPTFLYPACKRTLVNRIKESLQFFLCFVF